MVITTGEEEANQLKTIFRKIPIPLVLAAFVTCVDAQVSVNIVGYYTLPIYSGDNLIANQLDDGTNFLDDIFNAYPAPIPDGATFTKWDSAANTFLPASVYSAGSGRWSIDYSFTFGEGAVLHSPTTWSNAFVGQVYPPAVPYVGSGLDPTKFWHPGYAAGVYLISSPVPVYGPMDEMFPFLVGRLPRNGEWVRILNPATQTYLTTTFHAGTGWDNGDPTLSVGESAWVSLVPEPVTLNVCAIGAALLLLFRSRKSV